MDVRSKETGGGAILKNRSGCRGRADQLMTFVNPLFDPVTSFESQALHRSMASAGDGSDQGGTGEVPTHPKLSGGDAIMSVHA